MFTNLTFLPETS